MSVRAEEGSTGAPVRKPSAIRPGIVRALVLAAVICLSIYVFTIRAQAHKLAAYGYPGIFLISVLANATVVLPAPGIAVVFAMGSVFNPLFVGLAAGAGAAVGEITGYAAGFGGQGVLEHTEAYDRIMNWMRRYGSPTILLLAALPNPFFDLAGMAAGALRMPVRQFLFWCFVGKTAKMLFLAYTGAYSMGWLVDTFK
jgi:membrane protein YqaA with SNARE-associated domain